jgi:hypothetical protein
MLERWYLVFRMTDKHLHPAYRLIKSEDWGGIITKRAEPIRPNELLYDHNGHPVAIKANGQILAIIKGDL